MAKRRKYSRKFKMSLIEQSKVRPVTELSKEHNIHPTVIYRWKKEYEINPIRAFAGHGKICKLESKVAQYQQLVGKLYAEVDFLKKITEALKIKLAEEKIKRS